MPPEFLKPGLLTELYRERGIERAKVESEYAPSPPTRKEAALLRIGTGAPLIEERRVSYCVQGGEMVPYEFLLTLYTERVSLRFLWTEGQALGIRKRKVRE